VSFYEVSVDRDPSNPGGSEDNSKNSRRNSIHSGGSGGRKSRRKSSLRSAGSNRQAGADTSSSPAGGGRRPSSVANRKGSVKIMDTVPEHVPLELGHRVASPSLDIAGRTHSAGGGLAGAGVGTAEDGTVGSSRDMHSGSSALGAKSGRFSPVPMPAMLREDSALTSVTGPDADDASSINSASVAPNLRASGFDSPDGDAVTGGTGAGRRNTGLSTGLLSADTHTPAPALVAGDAVLPATAGLEGNDSVASVGARPVTGDSARSDGVVQHDVDDGKQINQRS
jgi:hypothetical protein